MLLQKLLNYKIFNKNLDFVMTKKVYENNKGGEKNDFNKNIKTRY